MSDWIFYAFWHMFAAMMMAFMFGATWGVTLTYLFVRSRFTRLIDDPANGRDGDHESKEDA